MITYLFKVTVIWIIFLCLYEWLFKRNSSFTLNRIYLFGALAAGLIVPLIAWNTTLFKNGISGVVAINNSIQNLVPATTTQQVGGAAQAVDWYVVIKWLYIAGVVLFAVISFREVVLILRTAIYGRFTTVHGHKIFSSEKKHAPFSFMGWIFISHPEQYAEEELLYIVKHENGHNSRKHWLDMILIQIVLIVFWFHPLVWYFRSLLKLTHEYDADKIAADDNVYDYGHFLLGQILLKGTPSIAHSFHYSPIKNRITMLTKTKKKSSLKYLFAIPVLVTCTFVFAKSDPSSQRVRAGDVTTYKGHRFYWEKDRVDSIQVMDPTTRETTWVVTNLQGRIYKMDNDSVLSNGQFEVAPQFRDHNMSSFKDYFKAEFMKGVKKLADSMVSVELVNIVLNDDGRIVYYDTYYASVVRKGGTKRSSITDNSPDYNALVEKIVVNSPNWLPGLRNGKPVKTYIGRAPELVVKFKE